MIIDTPQREDIPKLRQLWKQAFGDTDTFLDGFFATGFSSDRCLCLKQEDQLSAALYWFDCTLQNQPLAYVYAVATDTAFRGQGLCRKLMESTHMLLQQKGYTGALLVPGSADLFGLYKKLGYRSFCPMKYTKIPAGTATPLRHLTAAQYGQLRRQYLPAGGILQEGPTLTFLSTFAEFYAIAGGIFSGTIEKNTLYVQEYLGDISALPRASAALGCTTAAVFLPGGGSDRAMYLPLSPSFPMPSYFGIPLN